MQRWNWRFFLVFEFLGEQKEKTVVYCYFQSLNHCYGGAHHKINTLASGSTLIGSWFFNKSIETSPEHVACLNEKLIRLVHVTYTHTHTPDFIDAHYDDHLHCNEKIKKSKTICIYSIKELVKTFEKVLFQLNWLNPANLWSDNSCLFSKNNYSNNVFVCAKREYFGLELCHSEHVVLFIEFKWPQCVFFLCSL